MPPQKKKKKKKQNRHCSCRSNIHHVDVLVPAFPVCPGLLVVAADVESSDAGANIELMTQSALQKKFPWLSVADIELATYGL